ncbi:MAG: hypothetical protein JWQ17_3022 [Tardiphaga sp.]|nr:hypothetical protein [Tardiphaga sp.]
MANVDRLRPGNDWAGIAPRRRTGPALAGGDAVPVASPALELQALLDEMVATPSGPRMAYGRGVALSATFLMAAAACFAIWDAGISTAIAWLS